MRRNAGEASSRTTPSSPTARSIASSSTFATTIRSANVASTARSTAGRRSSRSASRVRRAERRSTAPATSSRPFHTLPTTGRRVTGPVSWGTGSGDQAGSPRSSARTAATRRCSSSSRGSSDDGTSARTRAAPGAEAARAATSSRSRGNSSRASACAFIAIPLSSSVRPFDRQSVRPSPSPLLGELLARDRVDGAPLGASVELRQHVAHHGTDLRGAAGDGGAHGGAQLVVADGGGKIALEHRDLGALLLGQVLALAGVHLDRLAPPLDPLAQHVHHFVVAQVAPQLDLPILGVGEDGAQHEHARLVLRLARGVQIGLQRVEEWHRAGSGGVRKSTHRRGGAEATSHADRVTPAATSSSARRAGADARGTPTAPRRLPCS